MLRSLVVYVYLRFLVAMPQPPGGVGLTVPLRSTRFDVSAVISVGVLTTYDLGVRPATRLRHGVSILPTRWSAHLLIRLLACWNSFLPHCFSLCSTNRASRRRFWLECLWTNRSWLLDPSA